MNSIKCAILYSIKSSRGIRKWLKRLIDFKPFENESNSTDRILSKIIKAG